MVSIVVTGDNLSSSEISGIFGTIYVNFGEFLFPAVDWTDFIESVLSMWANELLQHAGLGHTTFTLYFMDGSYQIDVTKNGAQMTCRCMDHGQAKYNIVCVYSDFLDSLKNALSLFNQILDEKQHQEGSKEFISAIKYNTSLIEKLTATSLRHSNTYANEAKQLPYYP